MAARGGLQARANRFFLRRPWVLQVILTACSVGVMWEVVQTEIEVPPQGTEILVFVLGTLALPVFVGGTLLLGRHERLKKMSSAMSSAVTLISSVASIALVVVAFNYGLGWRRTGSDADLASIPRNAQAFGAGVAATIPVAILALQVLFWRNRDKIRKFMGATTGE